MIPARAVSVSLNGVDGELVEVEVVIGGGLPRTVLVGLPEKAVYESRDRCKAAVQSSGLGWPTHLVTINLTPAGRPKHGTHYDLAIAAAVLAAMERVPADIVRRWVMLGELGLDGRVRRVSGLLPALLVAVDAGFERAIVPLAQVGEASLVEGLSITGVETLADLVAVLEGGPGPTATVVPLTEPISGGSRDLAEVVGQEDAKWALEVAAAGRHHVFFHGPPGVGKTMLAERLPTVLPDLSVPEAIEVASIRSLLGEPLDCRLDLRPPYADPHHNASLASLVGGGPRVARPGAVSRAHRGVLFLDEAPEFAPRVIESLRQPLESGQVSIGRSSQHVRYPARFQLVLAANPCPCGNAATAGAECRCAPLTVRRYRERLSGPVLDRIDIQQQLRPVRTSLLRTASEGEPSATIRDRVIEARERQRRRYLGQGFATNAEAPGSYLLSALPLPHGIEVVEAALAKGQLSARGMTKAVRLSWTLADLAGRDRPEIDDVRAALLLRRGDALRQAG